MNYLSYSTITEILNVPHSWINKQLGLERFQFGSYEGGEAAHRMLQSHVCGKAINPALGVLPTFDLVEEYGQDERTRVDYFVNDDFIVTGYIDGYDTKTGNMLEAKSYRTTPWTLGKFVSLVQWRIYALALQQSGKATGKMYGVTMPQELSAWDKKTVRVYEIPIAESDFFVADRYIENAIKIIERIEELAYVETKKHCGYKDCPFGCVLNKQESQSGVSLEE